MMTILTKVSDLKMVFLDNSLKLKMANFKMNSTINLVFKSIFSKYFQLQKTQKRWCFKVPTNCWWVEMVRMKAHQECYGANSCYSKHLLTLSKYPYKMTQKCKLIRMSPKSTSFSKLYLINIVLSTYRRCWWIFALSSGWLMSCWKLISNYWWTLHPKLSIISMLLSSITTWIRSLTVNL